MTREIWNRGSLLGRVRWPITNEARAGLVVRAFPASNAGGGESFAEAQTDEHGHFRLDLGAIAPTSEPRAGEGGVSFGIVLKIFHPDGRLLYTTPVRGRAELELEWLVDIPPAAAESSAPDFETVVGHKERAEALRRAKLATVADLRRLDPGRLAQDRGIRAAGLDEAALTELKSRAHLAVVANDPDLVDVLVKTGVDSVAQLAVTPVDRLKAEIEGAINDRRLRGTAPSKTALQAVQQRARRVYGVVSRAAVASVALSVPDCRRCQDGCCGDPADLSVISKAAYLTYLIRVFGADADELEVRFHQDFAAPECEDVALVRLGVEVLERALLAGDFSTPAVHLVRRLMQIGRAHV